MKTKEEKETTKILKVLHFADKDSIFFKTNLYKTTLKENLCFKNEKIKFSHELIQQAKQIIKAENLILRLTKISNTVSYYTSCTIEKYLDYLKMGLMVYSEGKDNSHFDKMFSDLNDYIETGIVKLKLKNPILNAIGLKHTSFREKYNKSKSNINAPEDCYAFDEEITKTLNNKK